MLNAILVSLFLASSAPSADKVLVREVSQAANVTKESMRACGATWKMHFTRPEGLLAEIVVCKSPTVIRYEIRRVEKGKADQKLTIYVDETSWFVDDGRTRRRYRPFEAVLPFASTVDFIRFSKLQFADELLINNDVLKVDDKGGGSLVFHTRGNLSTRASTDAALRAAKQCREKLQETSVDIPSKLVDEIQKLSALLDDGFPLHIQQATGIVTSGSIDTYSFSLLEFGLHTEAPRFKLNVADWEDVTAKVAQDPGDVLQIVFYPEGRTKQQLGDADLMLLNVKSGAIRRLPVNVANAMIGCFNSDRTKAFVRATGGSNTDISLYEVNLQTCESQRLVGDDLSGIWMRPYLSPDGLSIAAIKATGPGLKGQPYVIDVNTKRATAVGESINCQLVGWTPDNNSLVVVKTEPRSGAGASRSFLAKLTLDGTLKTIIEGDSACVLPSSKRLLYRHPIDRSYRSCDLDGNDVKSFGDGMVEFGYPCASVDGRLVMLRFPPNGQPYPCEIAEDSKLVRVIETPRGFWVTPSW